MKQLLDSAIQKNQGLGKCYQTQPLACVQTSLSVQIKSGRRERGGGGGVCTQATASRLGC